MKTTNHKSVQMAMWSFVGALGLTLFLVWDFLTVERTSSATGGIFVALMACATTYFQYEKAKRQRGLYMIGDDNPFDFRRDA